MTPPRLHVLTATGSGKAVILRRGPTRRVATIGWDRETDTFEMGQWLAGRIYEHRSDLSPDGRYVVCFAGKGGMKWWTAVSRAPWLSALAFWPQDHTWGGGGAFAADGALWLNGGRLGADEVPGLAPADPAAYPHSTDGFHMGGTFVAMMQRRGWRHDGGEGYDARLLRDLGNGWRVALTFAVGQKNRSILSHRYALEQPAAGRRIALPDWEWAETWKGAVQFAARGALWSAPADAAEGLGPIRQIRDFTAMQPDWRPAPPAATTGGAPP